MSEQYDLVVIGAGSGGFGAAFAAARRCEMFAPQGSAEAAAANVCVTSGWMTREGASFLVTKAGRAAMRLAGVSLTGRRGS